MNPLKANFSENLRRLRLLSGETQAELGESVNVAKTTINMYEKGNRLPSLETVKDLAAHFGVSVDYLLRTVDLETNVNELSESDETVFHENARVKIEIVFPLLIDEGSLTNRTYDRAVALAKALSDKFQNNKIIEAQEILDCWDLFGKAFSEKQRFASAGYIWAFFLLWVKNCLEFYETIDHEKQFTHLLLSDFYKEKSSQYWELKNELLEQDGGLVLKFINYMRTHDGLENLGDYYYSLRFLLDITDNDFPPDINAIVGSQLMKDLSICNNPYAVNLLSIYPLS